MTKGKGTDEGLGFLGLSLAAAHVSKHTRGTVWGVSAMGSFISTTPHFLG